MFMIIIIIIILHTYMYIYNHMHIPSHISWPNPRCRPSITIFTPFFSPPGTSTPCPQVWTRFRASTKWTHNEPSTTRLMGG